MAIFLGYGTGKDGAPPTSGTQNPTRVGCTGTAGSTTLTCAGTWSAGTKVWIHKSRGTGAGVYQETNEIVSDDGASVTLLYPLTYSYTDSGNDQSQITQIYEYTSGTVSSTVYGPAWDGSIGGWMVWMVNGVLTVTGSLNMDGRGYYGGYGPNGSNVHGGYAEGHTRARGAISDFDGTANDNGATGAEAVGAGDSRAGSGGGGSLTAQGTDGVNSMPPKQPGRKGLSSGTIWVFGGGGGGGSSGYPGASYSADVYGRGGNGGGGIIIFARGFVMTSGTVSCKGNDGANGARDGAGGGGGGAGGHFILYSETANIGTNKVITTGGTGGIEGGYPSGIQGGTGASGNIIVNSCSLTGSTTLIGSSSYTTGGHSWCFNGGIIL